MLSTKHKGILNYIVSYCERIESVTNGITRDEFDNNLNIREIVCFNILQIGELTKNFEPTFVELYGNQPWKDIKGMRDHVAHGYGSIIWDKVWEVVEKDIKPLKDYCIQILKEGN